MTYDTLSKQRVNAVILFFLGPGFNHAPMIANGNIARAQGMSITTENKPGNTNALHIGMILKINSCCNFRLYMEMIVPMRIMAGTPNETMDNIPSTNSTMFRNIQYKDPIDLNINPKYSDNVGEQS